MEETEFHVHNDMRQNLKRRSLMKIMFFFFSSLPTKIYEIINNRQEIEEYRLTDRQTRLILQLESANTTN